MSQANEEPIVAIADLSNAEVFFLAETARHARELPVNHCIEFFEGLSSLLKEDSPAQHCVQAITNFFRSADWHLDQLANAVLKQPEENKPPTTPEEE